MYSSLQTLAISFFFALLFVSASAQKNVDATPIGAQNGGEGQMQMSEDFVNQEMMPVDQIDDSFWPGVQLRGLRSSNGKPTFIRFGKRASPSFIRFGRK